MDESVSSNKINDITLKLQECIEQNFPRTKKLEYTLSDDLFEKGIVDSLGFLTIISFIENNFEITVADEDILPENFNSIKAMSDYILNKLLSSSIPVSE